MSRVIRALNGVTLNRTLLITNLLSPLPLQVWGLIGLYEGLIGSNRAEDPKLPNPAVL